MALPYTCTRRYHQPRPAEAYGTLSQAGFQDATRFMSSQPRRRCVRQRNAAAAYMHKTHMNTRSHRIYTSPSEPQPPHPNSRYQPPHHQMYEALALAGKGRGSLCFEK